MSTNHMSCGTFRRESFFIKTLMLSKNIHVLRMSEVVICDNPLRLRHAKVKHFYFMRILLFLQTFQNHWYEEGGKGERVEEKREGRINDRNRSRWEEENEKMKYICCKYVKTVKKKRERRGREILAIKKFVIRWLWIWYQRYYIISPAFSIVDTHVSWVSEN